MIQLELDDSQLNFIKQYNIYGFKDETELIKKALDYFQQQLNTERFENDENEDLDPFIDGLFSGSSDLATRSEKK